MCELGQYDQQIERSKQMLAEAKANYDDAVVKMADASPVVRETVLETYRSRMAEAEQMIVVFESENH